MSKIMRHTSPDYVAVGHLAVDITPEGPRLGGSAIYGALTVARMGIHAGVLTRANLDTLPPEVTQELEAVSSEVELIIQAGDSTTTFENMIIAGRRQQTIHDWAGEIDWTGLPPLWRSASTIHLAPIAQEFDARHAGRLTPNYLGVTPQGWLRHWPRTFPGRVTHDLPRMSNDVMSKFDGLVLSAEEYGSARELFEYVGRRGLSVLTQGAQGATAIDRHRRLEMEAYPSKRVDTTGAGDVFAGVLFALRTKRVPVSTCLRMASAAAAISIGGPGISAIPTLAETEQLVEIEASRP